MKTAVASRMPMLLMLCLPLAAPSIARAQTSAMLMLRPLPDDRRSEAQLDVFIFGQGETDGPGEDRLDLTLYEASGRAALTADPDVLRLGFDLVHLDLRSPDPAIPQRLSDQSIAAGIGLGRSGRWEFGATAGVGFAGDLPYSDSDAVYALGSLFAVHRVDEQSAWQLGLDYDGNRGVFPDVPFPFVAYSRRADETLSYTLGFPFSAVRWRPAERWTVTASASPASVISGGFLANVDWQFIDGWHAYAEYDSRFESFHLNGDDEHRRLFYRSRRIEAGLRWLLGEGAGIGGELRAAVGYGFDREFERGFDARDTDNVRDLSDEPYLRLGVDLAF